MQFTLVKEILDFFKFALFSCIQEFLVILSLLLPPISTSLSMINIRMIMLALNALRVLLSLQFTHFLQVVFIPDVEDFTCFLVYNEELLLIFFIFSVHVDVIKDILVVQDSLDHFGFIFVEIKVLHVTSDPRNVINPRLSLSLDIGYSTEVVSTCNGLLIREVNVPTDGRSLQVTNLLSKFLLSVVTEITLTSPRYDAHCLVLIDFLDETEVLRHHPLRHRTLLTLF